MERPADTMNGADGQTDVVTKSDVRWSIKVGKARRCAHEVIDQVPGKTLCEWYNRVRRRRTAEALSVLPDLFEWSEEREEALEQVGRLMRGLRTSDLIALIPVYAKYSEGPLATYRPAPDFNDPGPPPRGCEVLACSATGLKFRPANGDRPTGGKAG